MKRRLLLLSLLPLLVAGVAPSATWAQGRAKGLSLFPDGQKDIAPVSNAPYLAVAAAATLFTEGTCIVGDVLGFSVGSVLRWPVWALTLGDTIGSSEGFDRAGNAILEVACDAPWVFNPEYIKSLAQGP